MSDNYSLLSILQPSASISIVAPLNSFNLVEVESMADIQKKTRKNVYIQPDLRNFLLTPKNNSNIATNKYKATKQHKKDKVKIQ